MNSCNHVPDQMAAVVELQILHCQRRDVRVGSICEY